MVASKKCASNVGYLCLLVFRRTDSRVLLTLAFWLICDDLQTSRSASGARTRAYQAMQCQHLAAKCRARHRFSGTTQKGSPEQFYGEISCVSLSAGSDGSAWHETLRGLCCAAGCIETNLTPSEPVIYDAIAARTSAALARIACAACPGIQCAEAVAEAHC